jgi:hypothetical protein
MVSESELGSSAVERRQVGVVGSRHVRSPVSPISRHLLAKIIGLGRSPAGALTAMVEDKYRLVFEYLLADTVTFR